MSPAPPRLLPVHAALSDADQAALHDLYIRGTPEATLRAYERDLVYITAWRQAAFGAAPEWPEREEVALRFVLDHARDLAVAPVGDAGRLAAEALIAAGLRRSLACPAPATLDRRVASWRSFHRMKNLASPFDAPALRAARAKARRAAARPRAPKSAHPITRDVLERMLDACGRDLRGIRDRAVLLTGWASGGRRRSELVALDVGDLQLDAFDSTGVVRLGVWTTKTTRPGATPDLVVKGRAARALVAWLDAAGLAEGPLFRRVTRTGAVGRRRLSAAAVGQIVKRSLTAAGLPADYASAHGLRSGFLTQAALDGAPLPAAMRLSLHRSAAQAQAYYDDADLAHNPAADLLERPRLRTGREDETVPSEGGGRHPGASGPGGRHPDASEPGGRQT